MEGMTAQVLAAIEAETELSHGIVVGAHAYLTAELGMEPTPADVIGYLVHAREQIQQEGALDGESVLDQGGDAS